MKNTILLFALLITFCNSFSQLKGSGNTVTKTFNYSNFDKITFQDLGGKIEVEVGKNFNISVTIDDNLLNLLAVTEDANDNSLKVSLKGNNNNKMYIENTKIKVKITMPLVTYLKNNTNSSLDVSGINGSYLKIETIDNGSTTLAGTIENLDVKNSGNGVLNAKNLLTKNATLAASGNGNVYVNASDLLTAKSSGNCTLINSGKARFDAQSSASGNSRFINK